MVETTASQCVTSARMLFARTFGAEAVVVALAPGRVELLGNHTDYNGGLVLASAIDRWTVAAGRVVPGREAGVVSTAFPGTDRFRLDALDEVGPGWGRYVRGVAWALSEWSGAPLAGGFELALAGNVPLGAGLSSSASLQGAIAVFLIAGGIVRGLDIDRLTNDAELMELAKTLQRSENEFVGVGSGLLDQFSALFGREGHALTLDCRTLEFARLLLPHPAPAIVICDSKTARKLTESMYNQRRAECEQVVAFFRKERPVTQLRDLSLADLDAYWDALDPVGRRRARHVLTENERVREGAAALMKGDLPAFGRLMSASHASSRDDFENSSESLDALIEAAEGSPGFLGGKLTGAGWAGCTVNLVRDDLAMDFAESVRETFAREQGVFPDVHICRAAEGARLVQGLSGPQSS